MAGLPWFKLYGDFFSHPKTLELQAELGDPSADVYVVRMWAYVSRVAATGRLSGRNVVSVLERAVGWAGEPGRFVQAALRVGFLEQEPEALVVHDWAREQGAHVAKVEKDRARPPAHKRNTHTDTLPARDLRGNMSGSRESPEVEIEREREKKKEALSAGADLFLGAAATTKPKRSKPEPKTSEAEREGRKRLEAVYAAKRRGEVLPWDGGAWVSLRECLALAGGDVAKVEARFSRGLDLAAAQKWGGASTVHQLKTRWADLASLEATSNPESRSPDDERMANLRAAVAAAKAAGGAR